MTGRKYLHPFHSRAGLRPRLRTRLSINILLTRLQAEKVARALAREELSATERFFVTTSKVSQSLRLDVSPAEEA